MRQVAQEVDPQALITRYKKRIKLAGIARVYDVMKTNDVTIEDIQDYVASKDPNRAPLEKVRQHKQELRNKDGNPKASNKQPVSTKSSPNNPRSLLGSRSPDIGLTPGYGNDNRSGDSRKTPSTAKASNSEILKLSGADS